jgi:DNA ligase (NAD+)
MKDKKDILLTSENLLASLSSMTESALEDLIIYHNKKYFRDNDPEITDEAFDKIVESLRFLNPNSLVLSVIGPAALNQEIKHIRPMLSLDKCYDDENFFKWAEKIHGDLIAMPKIDGIASSLIYSRQGALIQAATRGDGFVGENITRNISMINDIITQLASHICQEIIVEDQFIEIRGEVFLPLSRFNAHYAQEFANARNLAAGALKHKDHEKSAAFGLKFLPYDLKGIKVNYESEKFILLERLGFSSMPWRLVHNNSEATLDFHYFEKQRSTFDFELDGVVFRANDLSDQRRLGETAHHPRYAMAYKFQGESALSEVVHVEWSVSRSGAITPVAIIKPVFISGAHISRVSLHNLGIFLKLNLKEQSLIEVERRGGVIPHVERVLSAKGKPLIAPDLCPSCNALTIVNGDFLFCSAKEQCRAVVVASLIHFAAVLGIEGLGEKIIYKLYDHGLCKSFKDIFLLTMSDLMTLERMGEVLARKLIQEIENKRDIELSVFIKALGINEVGSTVAELLASNFHSLAHIRALSVDDLLPIHGVGERIAQALVAGLKDLASAIDDLLKVLRVKDYEIFRPSDQKSALFGKSIVFTGKMAHLDRKSAQSLVKRLGGIAPGAINSQSDYLVIGDEKSALRGESQKSTKQKEAEKLIAAGSKLRIISESEFLTLSAMQEQQKP